MTVSHWMRAARTNLQLVGTTLARCRPLGKDRLRAFRAFVPIPARHMPRPGPRTRRRRSWLRDIDCPVQCFPRRGVATVWLGVSALVGAGQEPPAGDEKCAEREEAEVPGGLVAGLADVVDTEDVVVHDPFNEVEEAPADEHPSDEGASTDSPAPARGALP